MTIEAGCDIPLHLKENIEINLVITGEDGEPVDLSQADYVIFNASHLHRAGQPVINKEIETSSTEGEADILLEKNDTDKLRAGNYEYEVYVQFPDKEEYVANQATLFLKKRTGEKIV